MNFYSRVASASLIKEVSPNVGLTPNVFFGFNEEDIATDYQFTPSMPVIGNRSKNINPVKNIIPAPEGTLTMYIEPKTFGHFLNGFGGGVVSGRIIPFTNLAVAVFAVGETITGTTSTETATILFVGEDYLVVGSPSGDFDAAETITGGTSGATATVTRYATTVYGHAVEIPKDNAVTYSMQFNFPEHAIRYMGVRVTGIDSVGQEDNIITAGVKIMAQSQFRHALVTAITTSGAGAKTITVDQTQGLVAGDSIKIWRPGTGFIDFLSAGVKTHTIGTVPTALTLTVTNLQTSLAVGDILVLAPQTPSYSVAGEFAWIGGSTVEMGATIATLAEECIEDFTFVLNNEYESRHCAVGKTLADRFPQHIIQKSLEITGTFNTAYENEEFQKYQRANEQIVVRFKTLGGQIAATGFDYELRILVPDARFNPSQTSIGQDDVVNEELSIMAFHDNSVGAMARVLLVNDITSY
jgi:hypothetical protein